MELFKNPTLVVPAVAWLIANFLKFGVKAMRGDVSVKYFYKSGDMPSVHTAIVSSLLVTVGFVEGVDSTFFGISLVLAMIVTYDALNVRRAVGEQGGMIERLLLMQKSRVSVDGKKVDRPKLSEVLGHTPMEVAAGAVVGVVVSVLLLHSYWPEGVTNYVWSYSETEQQITKVILLAVLVVSTVGYFFLKRRSIRKLPSAKSLASKVAYGLLIPAIFGLVVVWSNEVGFLLFESKAWLIATVTWMVVVSIVFIPSAINKFAGSKDEESKALKEQKRQKRKKRRKK